jgi:Spy/CpxP family protein refolding chaperone
MSDQSSPDSAPAPRRRRGWLFVTTIALVAALTGAAASQAVSHGPGYWRARAFMGPLDPAQAEERADRFMRHVAIELDATAEQQDKLRTIAKATVKDLIPMRDKARTARERARELLTQPTIDRAAIEAFRTEQMALAEAASKRIAQALGDAAEVLTPEQRREVDSFLQWRRSHWRPWHRG